MTIFAHTPHSQIETGSTTVVYPAPPGDLDPAKAMTHLPPLYAGRLV